MVEARARGYFGIGAEGVSKSANVGALLRTGHAFGASFCFTIGTGWDARAARTADTADTPLHVPMWRYPLARRPVAAPGLRPGRDRAAGRRVDLPSFRHPLNAAYVLGPERAGLSPELLQRCDHVVRIPTRFALNLAVAGALVLYDRLLQHGRFADRPVGSRRTRRPASAHRSRTATLPQDNSSLASRQRQETRRREAMKTSCLFRVRGGLIGAPMNTRFHCFLTVALLLALPAAAESKKPAPPAHAAAASGPKSIGKFEDWTAATHSRNRDRPSAMPSPGRKVPRPSCQAAAPWC